MKLFNVLTYCLALPIKLLINRIQWYGTDVPCVPETIICNHFNNGRIDLYGRTLYEHGISSFRLKRAHIFNEKITQATVAFVNQIGREDDFYTVLVSAYIVDNNDNYSYTSNDTGEDSLLGLLIALQNDDNILLREKYEFLLNSMIENNYCLVNIDKGISKNGNFSPRVQITASEMNTMLAFLKFGASIGIKDAKIHYKKLIRLGYGLFKSDNAIANKILNEI